MASYTATKSKHATLTGTTVDTVNITSGYEFVEVVNRDTTNPLYFTVGGTTPTAAGDNTEVVLPNSGVTVEFAEGTTAVKIIGNGNAYSVTGVSS